MATAQKQRNSVSAVVFPKTIATEQQSLLVVKRLLAVAVSCITYLRGIFPESAYGTRFLDDVSVKILREDKNSPGSTQLVKWMLGCYDALQKKYLRQIVLAVYTQPEDPQTITECYHFKFKYTQNGPLLDFGSKEKPDSSISCADTKRASILLIRKIFILMQNLSPLPNDVCLTMKLLYYDEVTPADYQPPGFREARCEGMLFQEEPTHLNVGEVPTPFHLLRLRISTERRRLQDLELPAPAQDDPDLDKKMENENLGNIPEPQVKNSPSAEEAEEMQTPRVSNPQVDFLTYKTSELVVSESRTRSGKIFQSSIVPQAELGSSQDLLPKRRKLSEPTEQF